MTAIAERRVLHTQIAVELVDDVTGEAPLGRVAITLEVDRGGTWLPVPARPVFTASSVAAFPGIGLTARPNEKPTHTYRVRCSSPLYRPLYDGVHALEALEFVVHPFDHQHPPAVTLGAPRPAYLLPSVRYAFAAGLAVLRGRVEDATGAPVADALVEESTRERVLTDERGEFRLPLRWVAMGSTVTIDARDRSGRFGNLSLNVPGDLAAGQVITVS
jgi:hypothetical protein